MQRNTKNPSRPTCPFGHIAPRADVSLDCAKPTKANERTDAPCPPVIVSTVTERGQPPQPNPSQKAQASGPNPSQKAQASGPQYATSALGAQEQLQRKPSPADYESFFSLSALT